MAEAPSHAEVLARYCGAFVDELAAQRLEHVCLCPGSRSTPLALMFARHRRIKVWTHLDERSCAYFALGMAKASGKPVAVLCSSGTAAVNFAPAVVEAYHASVPLIVLTADRPQELRDLGSNQTIDQVRLYGPHVKWSAEMLLPEASEQALRYVRMAAQRSLATASGTPAGPVHLNFPFREPLLPADCEWMDTGGLPRGGTGAGGRATEDQGPACIQLPELERAERPILVCGPGGGLSPDTLGQLESAGVPVLADALSGVRTGSFPNSGIVGSYDSFLRPESMSRLLRPDLAVRLGAPPTSKALATYLSRQRDVPQVVIAPAGRWPDPELTATRFEQAPRGDGLKLAIRKRPRTGWLDLWLQIEAKTLDAVARVAGDDEYVSEPHSILDLAAVIPDGSCVLAGNSMPVRDLDSFWPVSGRPTRLLGNRGASGIDGVVSTALGAAAVTSGRVVAVIGDLSFYHDMNGLLACRRFELNATVVLINNDGGGIFSFLPQHEQEPEHFEALFGTPHGLDFSPVADLYGVDFQRVRTREEYRAALKASFESDGVQVIEIKTDREENLKLHQRIWDEVAKALAPLAREAAAG